MEIKQIEEYLIRKSESNKIFITSSFQTHSIPLLHIISKLDIDVSIYFINTGFHFPETIAFKNEIARKLSINVQDIVSDIPKIQQRNNENEFFYTTDPDYCCFINKTSVLEPYLRQYDIWISGVRAGQSLVRKAMKTEQAAPHGCLRFHPILDWSAKDIYEYRVKHNLPEHPLDKKGYQSIGCAPCTMKIDVSDERMNRWFGLNKTECGLHTELINSK